MARKNWLLGLGAAAVIAVPLGVALKQDLEQAPPAAAPPAAPAAPEVPVAPAGPAAPPAPAAKHMPPDFFRDVLGTGKRRPELVGPLFRVQWGVTRDELRRAAPELFSWHHPDVTIHPRLDEAGKVAAIDIEFPDDGTALATLRAAWGDVWRSADGTIEVSLSSPESGTARVVVSPAGR